MSDFWTYYLFNKLFGWTIDEYVEAQIGGLAILLGIIVLLFVVFKIYSKIIERSHHK